MRIGLVFGFIFLVLLKLGAQRSPMWASPPFYKYQLGATVGVSDVSAPLTDFPGSHIGIYVRGDRHTFGLRREWDGEFFKIFGEPVYYHRIGIFYGWSDVRKNAQWGPQLAMGYIEYNHEIPGTSRIETEDGFYGEIAVNGLVSLRGNGIGLKVFLNLNKFTVLAGGTVYLQFGYAWNDKPLDTPVDEGTLKPAP